MRQLVLLLLAGTAVLAACGGGGGGGNVEPTSTAAATRQPTAASTPSPGETPPAARIPGIAPTTDIKLPTGFAAYPIATGFLRATSVAPAPDGSIFVSERGGTVYRLVDANGDGVFEQNGVYASGFAAITGLAVAPDGALYVSSTGKITTVRDTNNDGIGDASEGIISGLPTGRHQNNGMAIGPDGKLYITNGSDCDDCTESDERSASILQAHLDGSDLRVFAHGLRNPYDITFDDQGRLWSTDNGSDTPCATIDELDLIVDGGDYGWPYGADGCDPMNDGTPPVASLGLHTASTGLAFYDGTQFPAAYRTNLFATLWGSLAYGPTPAEYKHALVRADVTGDTGIVEVFGSGFAHPIDVYADADGSLLVLDYGPDDPNAHAGTLYRIVYAGQ
jgi:putative membrane-bound dehydrogenase-like protein